jgi:hypothetical protein
MLLITQPDRGRALGGHWAVEAISTLLICLTIVVVLTSNAMCDDELGCGKEFRFVTKDGVVYQGKLQSNTGTVLTLQTWQIDRIELSNVEQAFRIKRHTLAGVIFGSAIGTGVGVYTAAKWAENNPPKGWLDFQIEEKVGITLACTIVGGVIGGILGHLPAHENIEIDMIPICPSAARDMKPLHIGLTCRF